MLDEFKQLIAQQTGIVIRPEEQKYLDKIIAARCDRLQLSSAEYYHNLSDKKYRQEWQTFISLITNNESYFFRDREQLKIVRDSILPEIIDRHRDDRTLRICSAGCSTGQEPYTLAIILQELLPDIKNWQITILGIDIDETALETARKGVYESWSFRGIKGTIENKYFQKINRQYHLNPEIKNMVEFQNVNLVKTHFPQSSSNLRDFDLIICRNVFIYFNSSAIEEILNKFYRSLQPSGYLVVGHTELHDRNLDLFKIKVFDHSLIYQRPDRLELLNFNKNNSIETVKQTQTTNFFDNIDYKTIDLIQKSQITQPIATPIINIHQNLAFQPETLAIDCGSIVEQVSILRERQQYQQAISELENSLANAPNSIELYLLLAELNADLGNYQQAEDYCQKAISIDSLELKNHYLLAQITEAQNKISETKQILKKIIYLEPSFINAYIQLSQIYRQEKDNI
jgi:chemotaxis protein methyltransferase CheR